MRGNSQDYKEEERIPTAAVQRTASKPVVFTSSLPGVMSHVRSAVIGMAACYTRFCLKSHKCYAISVH